MVSPENLLLIVSTSIAGSFTLIGGIITLLYAKKRKNRIIYLFSANWFFQAAQWYLIGMAHFTYSTILMAMAYIPQCIGVLCVFVFIELIEEERVHPVKISILTLIITLYLVFTFLPGSMEIIPDYGVHIIGACRIFQIIFLLYYMFIYFDWSYKTWKNAPLDMRGLANQLLIGSIIFSFVSLIFYMIGSILRTFNAITFIVHNAGAFITIIVIRKEPKIIHVLPFKAYRLVVFETKGGIGLFSHDWADIKEVEKGFFSMMFQAVGSVLNEILNKGNVRDIHLDEAVLLVQHDKNYPIASVLITSKSSKSLRDSLKNFHDQFISQFSTHFDAFHNLNKFRDAQKIVKQVFGYVPFYKHEDIRKLKSTLPPKIAL
jgi:hypothetical protein